MKNPRNYIDGRTNKKYYCKDCKKKKIGLRTGVYGGARCRSCAQKNRMKNLIQHPTYIDGRR